VEEKNIDESWMGFIFSIYSVAVIVGSPLVEKIIPRLGRRNIVQGGLITMGTSFILFGQLGNVDDKRSFLNMALFIRFL
jgi:MFS family permease